jgi:hypothetical protein
VDHTGFCVFSKLSTQTFLIGRGDVTFLHVTYTKPSQNVEKLTCVHGRFKSPFFLWLIHILKAVTMTMVMAITFFWSNMANPAMPRRRVLGYLCHFLVLRPRNSTASSGHGAWGRLRTSYLLGENWKRMPRVIHQTPPLQPRFLPPLICGSPRRQWGSFPPRFLELIGHAEASEGGLG